MATRTAHAVWDGDLKRGRGSISLGENGTNLPYNFASRFLTGPGTNPEELVAGAHAGCFSMAFAHELVEAGYPPTQVATTARVHLEKSSDGFAIPRIDLETEADVPNVDDQTFQLVARAAKENCPLSRLLAAAQITLHARLLSHQRA
ncbi:MAG TPA: OsmC family protein [Thermoguttaceae bacterium]|nr:OsmC family protein [Thermoguttaceae bacterium]